MKKSAPSPIPPLTPVGYYTVKKVPGRRERRLVGYIFKRFKRKTWKKIWGKFKSGKKRFSVYRVTVTPERHYRSWHVVFPELYSRWFIVSDYQQALDDQKELDGFEVTEREMEIFYHSPADDLIHLIEERRNGRAIYTGSPTLFVWKSSRLPTKLKVYGSDQPFGVIRIWFWVFHIPNKEYRLWCRSASIVESNFNEAWDSAEGLYNTILGTGITRTKEDSLGRKHVEHLDYLDVREMVAWTAYTHGEKAAHYGKRRTKKGEREMGGSQ